MNEWNNIPDDELDAILKKSAENFTPGFDESAWKDMSEKLDRGAEPANPGKPYAKWVKWPLMGLVALLFVSGIYYWVSRKGSTPVQSTENTKSKKEESISQKREDLPSVANHEPEVSAGIKTEAGNISEDRNEIEENKPDVAEQKRNTLNPSESKPRSEANRRTALTTEHDPVVKTGANGSRKEAKGNENTLFAKQNKLQRERVAGNGKAVLLNGRPDIIKDKNGQNAASPVKTDKGIAATSEPGVVSNVTVISSSEKAAAAEDSELLTKKWGSVSPLKKLRFKQTTVVSVLPEIRNQSSNMHVVDPVNIAGKERGFGFRVIYSPDFTTIGSNKIFKIGNNIGLVGEYRFNSRWSVQAGAIKSLKYYEATPDQYKWPYFLVKPGNPLKVISATCNMLDIPVNVRYDFFSRPQQKWFASAGFTNYLMLKEKYKYTYEIDDDPAIKSRAWEGKTGFYPFGVLNLSGGYERRVTRKLSIQGEPFFKIPLGEVGYGKVKLITIGVFISGKIEI